MPFWRVDVSTDAQEGGRDIACVVSAPTTIQAVMAALATVDLPDDELLHVIHVSPPKDSPHELRGGERK